MKTYRPLLMIALLVASMLACNISVNSPAPTQDPNTAYTAAAQTVSAQLTNAALSKPAPLSSPTLAPAVQPSSTLPAPTIAPATVALPSLTSISACDRAEFVADVTVQDNTAMTPGQDFTKTWRLKNTGTCSWTPSYSVVFSSGSQMSAPSAQALTGNVNPGQTVDISVDMTAPTAAGTYHGEWKLRNASGVTFFGFYVQIIVSSGGGGGGSPAFTVTAVNYALGVWNDVNHTNCPRVTAYITTNGAGTITYHWRRSDGDANTQSLSFPGAGTKAINYDWARGSTWNGTNAWLGIYIEDPNNQDFGHLNFTSACTSP